MNLATISAQLIKERIQHSVFDCFDWKHLKKPEIDMDRIAFLLEMLEEVGISEEEIAEIAEAIMLIQLSLDIHDYVSLGTDGVNDSRAMMNRQLIILYGDYCSASFYQKLAYLKQERLIKNLSDGIKDITGSYIDVHFNQYSTEIILSKLAKIESSILVKVCETFQLENWKEQIINFFLYKRIKVELNNRYSTIINDDNRSVFHHHLHSMQQYLVEEAKTNQFLQEIME